MICVLRKRETCSIFNTGWVSICCVVLVTAGFMLPHAKALSSYSLTAHTPTNPHAFGPLPHHPLQQAHLGAHSGASTLKTSASLGGGSALWEMDNTMQPIRGFSGSSGYQSGGSHAGTWFRTASVIRDIPWQWQIDCTVWIMDMLQDIKTEIITEHWNSHSTHTEPHQSFVVRGQNVLVFHIWIHCDL